MNLFYLQHIKSEPMFDEIDIKHNIQGSEIILKVSLIFTCE